MPAIVTDARILLGGSAGSFLEDSLDFRQFAAHDGCVNAVTRDLRVLLQHSPGGMQRDDVRGTTPHMMVGTRIVEKPPDELSMALDVLRFGTQLSLERTFLRQTDGFVN